MLVASWLLLAERHRHHLVQRCVVLLGTGSLEGVKIEGFGGVD